MFCLLIKFLNPLDTGDLNLLKTLLHILYIASKYSGNSEAFTGEFLEYLEQYFPQGYMAMSVVNSNIQPHNSVTWIKRVKSLKIGLQ